MRVQREVVKIFTTATGAELVDKALKEKEKAFKEKMEAIEKNIPVFISSLNNRSS